jgi:hypothetical protein
MEIIAMVATDTTFPSVVRTERGLTVGGTRLTLYLLEDHFRAGWPNELVQEWFRLTDQELADVVGYIAAHRDEFDSEYEHVVQQAEATRKYWEDRNRERFEQIKNAPLSPEQAARRAKLDELRKRRQSR